MEYVFKCIDSSTLFPNSENKNFKGKVAPGPDSVEEIFVLFCWITNFCI